MIKRLSTYADEAGIGLLIVCSVVSVIIAASLYFGGPAAYEAVDRDPPAIPVELADHQTRGDMERGQSVGATPSQALPRYPEAEFIASPNWSGRGTCGIEGIVLHVTGPGSMAGMASWFRNPASQVSATFGIGKNGEVQQYVEVGDSAWHAGILNRPDLTNPLIAEWVNDGINPNRCTVGIELLLGGPAEPLSDYPAMQASLVKLLDWLHETTGVPLDKVHVMGHNQIDGVSRATDPVCCYTIARVLELVQSDATARYFFPDGWSYDASTGDWWNPAGEREWSACNSDRLRWNYIVNRWFPEGATGGFDPLPTRNYWSLAGAC
jgi:N-acetyl-anhydromuramyl-L-alanine amidase AmpD